MSTCQCQGIESNFDTRLASKQVVRGRRKGPPKSTRLLIEALKSEGVQRKTLLDIGAGIGVVHQELLKAGATEAIDVDASSAYLDAARAEAGRLGLDGRVRFHHGDFVQLAPVIPSVDIVTLDRVICCYDDVKALVSASSEKARRTYALVYPRDAWWVVLGHRVMNGFMRLGRTPFRVFVHPTRTVESILRTAGFRESFRRNSSIWQVVLYRR